jgi:hypothetical protein
MSSSFDSTLALAACGERQKKSFADKAAADNYAAYLKAGPFKDAPLH